MDKKILLVVIALVLLLTGFVCGRRYEKSRTPEYTEHSDTVTVIDTVFKEKPVPVEVIKWKTVPEYFAVHDTTLMVDSVLVDVPMERLVYQEDSVFYAVISGYKASLDTLKIYNEITTIEHVRKDVEYKPYKWTISPFVSAEANMYNYQAKAGLQGEFGKNRLRFVPEVGYSITSFDDGGIYAGLKLKFDLIRKK